MKNNIYVGIGASAGGLKVFETLVPHLPQDNNYTYIIAQHLDPTKKSSLVDILKRYTSLPVQEITVKTTFLPNTIYIIPAGYNLVYKQNRLLLEQTNSEHHRPTPSVDKLFKALAFYKGSACIGIILTGSGNDGTLGMQTIKECNGVTIAQDPKEASCASMPQSAIDAQAIDYIMTINEIYQSLKNTIHPKSSTPLDVIQQLLCKQENFNIDKYKTETILRRINKRMLLVHKRTLKTYLKHIEQNKDELHLLYQDILIGVTKFFRDKEAFNVLKNKLFDYLQDKPENYELKIWSIACSTGEEAYSIAILIAEIAQELHKHFNVKIFASDIDEKALKKARQAIYSFEAVNTIENDIRHKYFIKLEQGYKVVDEIRKNIVFTKHNILSDPPFINQDIISCRNLLIYINPETQQEVFKLFHYILKNDGILFLGSSESTLVSVKYFNILSSEYRIYQKEKLKNPPKISSHYFSKHLEEKSDAFVLPEKNASTLNIEENISHAIFDYFIPNCLVIDKSFSIIYKKGDLPFVKMPDGFITLNILDNIHKSLQYDVRKIINLSFQTANKHATKFIELQLEQKKTFVRIIAHPYAKTDTNNMLLLYFQELNAEDLQFNTQDLKLPDESFVIKSLTNQLMQAQEDNHALSDKLVVYKENMQLLNEELQSSNEELQSSNEELETSNEELQSSNEELHISIANEQKLHEKLSGILNASQNGIIGLDINGNHTFVNDATLNLLGFSRDELIGHNAHKLWHHTKKDGSIYPFEECQLHNHLKSKEFVRTEDIFWKKDGTPIEVEILQNPIVDQHKVVGAVLSFHDITEKNRLKREAEHEHRLANLYMNIIGTLVMTLDLDGNITMINKEGAKILGSTQKKLIGKNWFDSFIPQEMIEEIKSVFHSILSKDREIITHYKNPIVDMNNKVHILSWSNNYIKDAEGNITGIISSGIDITKEEKLSQKLFEQEHLYKLTFEEANIGIAHTSLDGQWIDTNEYLNKLLGYSSKEMQTMHVSDITYKDDIDIDKQMMQQLINKEKSNYHIEKRYIHKDGSIIWVALSVVLLKNELGVPLYFLKIIRDISQIKLLMYQLEEENKKFEKIINFTPIPVMLYSEDGEILLTNKIFHDNLGYGKNEITTIDTLIKLLFKDEEVQDAKNYYNNPIKYQHTKQTITTKSGEKRIGILNSVELTKNDSTSKKLYLIAIVDITDLQAKDELMLAQSRQAAMGDMLAMIAHQWRQPLSIMAMLVNNIKVKVELNEELTHQDIDHLVTTLNKQAQYLSQTIDDFRDFFKPDKIKEEVTLYSVITKVENLMLKSLEKNNIKFILPENKQYTITLYTNQLVQVLLNLINNAKDAIKSNNTIDGFIKIDTMKKKEQIIISVCDNGGGIDPSIEKKLGQPYVSTKSQNGTGLGLYMSIMIVKNHLNGKLSWENTSDGSCFYITLPPS